MVARNSYLVAAGIGVFCVAAFMTAAHIVFDTVVDGQNRRQLDELNRRIVERAEHSIDYAFIALGELAQKRATNCSAAALSEVRREVYRRSTIKDIRIVDRAGNVACSAFAETLGFDMSSGETAVMPSQNLRLRLFRIERQTGVALGLRWYVDAQTTLEAVVNTEAMLFDMLPADLRESTEIFVKLSNGQSIANYSPYDPDSEPPPGAMTMTRESGQYPLAAHLHIHADTFAHWNKGARAIVLLIAGSFGLLLAILIARLVGRPANPVAEMDAALARHEFKPYLQPIFALDTGAIVGCEALARWQRGDGSVLPPSQFIPLAEASGRIVPLTWQIVTGALAELRDEMQRDPGFKVSFNIVPEHFMAPGFAKALHRRILAAKVSPQQVMIELTERQEIQDLDAAARVIDELHVLGLKVALDDAGTGHSGLSYVQKLRVNTIKIDKFFIDAIGRDPSARPVVEMLVRLARELNMTTVAEGIETQAQIASLQTCGVDEGQGYCLAPPLPVPAFLDLVRARVRAGAPTSVSQDGVRAA